MIITGIALLLAGAWMWTQSRSEAKLPACVMTVGVAVMIVGIFS